MATIVKEIPLSVSAEAAWERVSDVGNIASLISFIGTSELDGNTRVCTLQDGAQLNEKIVSVDTSLRRVVYTITDAPMPMDFHAASMEVKNDGAASKLVWTVDVLPNETMEHLEPMVDQACADIRLAIV